MHGTTHTVLGIASALAVAPPDPTATLICVSVAVLCARLPDSIERPLRLDHRKASHSVYAIVLVAVIGLVVCRYLDASSVYAWAAVASYTSHIVADALTLSGVYVLAPTNRTRRLHLMPRGLRPRTGGAVDHLIAGGVGLYLMWLTYPSVIEQAVALIAGGRIP